MQTKVCSSCKEEKTWEEFCKSKKSKNGIQSPCKNCWNKKYRGRYKSIHSMNRMRFGGLREVVMLRDGGECKHCGQTREEHRKEFGRDLTIDHIDGNGRYSLTPNNSLNNLQVLCLRCHSRKDVQITLARKRRLHEMLSGSDAGRSA